jgi:hypothetical protein
MIIASPTRLVGGRADDFARSCASLISLFFIVSGRSEWARRGLILRLRGSLIHHAAQGVIERISTAARSWAGGAAALLIRCY